MTFVYGNPIPSESRSLWSEIDCCHFHSGFEWVVLGDFNEVLHPHEKEGLRPCNMGMVQLFRDFVNQSDLLDLELKGNAFTWFSNPRRGVIVREKLDRVLTNWPWREMFPHSIATTLPAVSSDHSPIVLDTDPRESSGWHFKYELMWDEHSECKEVVKRGWSKDVGEKSGWEAFLEKTKNCTRELRRWHSSTFKNALKEIPKLKEKLFQIQNSSNASCDWNEMENILNIKAWQSPGKYLGLPADWGVFSQVASLQTQGVRRWDIRKINELFPREIAQKIVQTPLRWEGDDDIFYWPHDRTGNYSVRSAYFVGRSERELSVTNQASHNQVDKEIWKWIWRVKCPQKIKLFLWRACTSSLPVLFNLHRRSITELPDCPICGLEPETTEHAFFNCTWVPPIWFGSNLQWNFDGAVSIRFDQWFLQRIQVLKQNSALFENNLSYLCCVLWYIWKNRSSYVYTDNKPNPIIVIQQANRFHTECINNLVNLNRNLENFHQGPIVQNLRVSWRPPKQEVVKPPPAIRAISIHDAASARLEALHRE
ncbi:Reverse transcriptase zinc-binding domain [Sesbania bispinosa]|nr:Reverse transcriptase zinc-binding domain [Sesbania bispinosa]